jgi:D-aminopeptidase
MTPEQSALAVLVESADWEKALGRMADLNLQGEVIVQELVAEHLAAIEKLVDVPPTTEAVPEELKVEASAEAAAPAEAPATEAAPAKAAPARAAGLVFWDDARA